MAWIRGHTIGHGSTATVSAATNHHTGEIFAVKSTELAKSKVLQREQKILSTLDSPFIVGYKGYDVSMENNKLMFNLMLEYFPDGSLLDAIHKKGGRLEESTIGFYTRRIVEGLEYLHSNGIAHCDIKGRNFLLGRDGPKIADFGCAKLVEPMAGIDNGQIKTVATGGTPLFMSPEVARGEDQGFPADIWALGCTVLEMATGNSPWPNATNAESLMYRIAFSGESPEIPAFLSDQAKDFLRKCLKRDPKDRWTAKQLLNHQFLGEINSPVLKQSQEFNTSSPTCVLDQDIWSSIEGESKTRVDDWINESSLNSSPAQRVKCLSEDSGEPSWDWDETWIMIRSSSDDEKSGGLEMEICGTLTDVSWDDVKLESRNSGDENSMNILDGNVGRKSRFSDNILISICTEYDHTVVISNVNFDKQKPKTKINQIHFL